ncbi:MAG: hypothetical protein WAM69_02840 [Candidatus Sulfotelmatobacter sp.]
MARAPTGLIRRINRKLAPEGEAVAKTQGKSISTEREYYVLDCRHGTKRYLSLNDVCHMAREMGLLRLETDSVAGEREDLTP